MEIWKDIEGYEGLYQVSNTGKVKVVSTGIIKKYSVLPKGYFRVGLTKNKKIKYFYPHRLVAEAFLENKENKPCINHRDCNPQNNEVSNLEWCSYKENNDYKNGLLKRKLSSIIYFMKKDYPNEKEIINELNDIKNKINKL